MDIDTHNELETKAGIALDAVVSHGDMMRAFEALLIRLLQPSPSRGTVNRRAKTGWLYAVMLSNADVICMSVLSTARLAA